MEVKKIDRLGTKCPKCDSGTMSINPNILDYPYGGLVCSNKPSCNYTVGRFSAAGGDSWNDPDLDIDAVNGMSQVTHETGWKIVINGVHYKANDQGANLYASKAAAKQHCEKRLKYFFRKNMEEHNPDFIKQQEEYLDRSEKIRIEAEKAKDAFIKSYSSDITQKWSAQQDWVYSDENISLAQKIEDNNESWRVFEDSFSKFVTSLWRKWIKNQYNLGTIEYIEVT